LLRLKTLLRNFRRFLEQTVFGDRLETIADLDSRAALAAWAAAREPAASDFRLFLQVAEEEGLAGLGRGQGRFMSYGAYALDDALFARGVWEAGKRQPLDLHAITEDITSSWLAGPSEPLPPRQGITVPVEAKEGAYSWCKAPRLAGRTVETGALARQVVNGHPLLRELGAATGGDVFSRVVARLLELALVLPQMERWAARFEPGAPYCRHARMPTDASGVGLVEAARGGLGHWLEVRGGRIRRYQIIAPTTWNFSPRDAGGLPGPLEQALVGTTVEAGAANPVAVQHIVRSFDPCMVCTVH
jgi:hydrogenase large subunit